MKSGKTFRLPFQTKKKAAYEEAAVNKNSMKWSVLGVG